MRNTVVTRAAAGSVLLIALALSALLIGAGTAQASSASRTGASAPPPNAEQYCRLYEQTLAIKLGVTTAQLVSANQSALTTTIDKAYADGAINKTQQQKMLQRVSQLGNDPCAAVGRAAAVHQQLVTARQATVSAVASALRMQPSALESALASGKSVPQLATAQNVDIHTVNGAYYTAIQNQLKMAVQNGNLTQAQSTGIYAKIQRAVANGRYPQIQPH